MMPAKNSGLRFYVMGNEGQGMIAKFKDEGDARVFARAKSAEGKPASVWSTRFLARYVNGERGSMTPERAKELAETNGCQMRPLRDAPHLKPRGYMFERALSLKVSDKPIPDTVAIVHFDVRLLEQLSEADFIASLPDKRD